MSLKEKSGNCMSFEFWVPWMELIQTAVSGVRARAHKMHKVINFGWVFVFSAILICTFIILWFAYAFAMNMHPYPSQTEQCSVGAVRAKIEANKARDKANFLLPKRTKLYYYYILWFEYVDISRVARAHCESKMPFSRSWASNGWLWLFKWHSYWWCVG